MIAGMLILAYAFTGSFCQKRIWGGELALIDDWPSMVSLLTRDDQANTESGVWNLRCGGVIITKSHVLTSAWCLKVVVEKELGQKDVIVRGNTEYWKCSCGRKRDHIIGSYAVHEDFKEPSPFNPTPFYENDIGIVTIEDTFSGLYELPKPYTEAASYWNTGMKKTTVIGWGLNSNELIDDQLHYAHIHIFEWKTCKRTYGRSLPPFTYCASDKKLKQYGPCEYDTGGPQFGIVKPGEYVLIGIVSTGEGCGKKPPVFTNISGFTEWIHGKVVNTTPDYNWNSANYS